MGLDLFFTKRTLRSVNDPNEVLYLDTTGKSKGQLYLRKVPALLEWLHHHGKKVDNCGSHLLSSEQLNLLLEDVRKLLDKREVSIFRACTRETWEMNSFSQLKAFLESEEIQQLDPSTHVIELTWNC